MPSDPVSIVLLVVLLVVSLGIHEAAHAWVALKCGDTTARDLGRITINPVPHIDPFMTILLPMMLIYFNAGFLFGGAKPVPVAFHRLRNPWRDMSLVAIAGPLSNFLLAILFMLIYKLAVSFGGYDNYRPGSQDYQLLTAVMWWSVYFNLTLAAFNLIPIPPLDGSRIMAWLMPESARRTYIQIERYGLLVIMGLIYLGAFRHILGPMVNSMFDFVLFLVSGNGAW